MLISLLFASTAALAAPQEGHHDHGPQLGKLSFPTTCSAPAGAQFELGLRWLHSFEYDRAEREFTKAADTDPGCAIAHWGVAMANYHPLWAPPTAAELVKGKAAVAKARAAGAKSKREQDYVASVGAFYDNSETLDKEPFAVFGRVSQGMNVVEAFNSEYGETSGGGIRAGKQAPLFEAGNAYLDRSFPRLDRIIRASVRTR